MTPSTERPSDVRERDFVREEQELKIDELKLKIKELKKPGFQKLSTWTSMLAIVIALGGVLGQNILSNIKSERAELNLKEAEVKKEAARKDVEQAKIELSIARDSQDIAQQEYDQLKEKIDSAGQYLAELQKYISGLSDSNAGIQSGQLRTIRRLIEKTKEVLPMIDIPVANFNHPVKLQIQFGNAQLGSYTVLVYDPANKLIAQFKDQSEVTLPHVNLATTNYLLVRIFGIIANVNDQTNNGSVLITFRQNGKLIANQRMDYQFETKTGLKQFSASGKVYLKK